ncbi:MAG: hypothetical protein ACOCUJ_03650 [Thiohalospira sp.]|uniref:hypothetical protein n=1 Tax=Thiohalospira sp. TaxID=3080549 RepID=UPI003981539F
MRVTALRALFALGFLALVAGCDMGGGEEGMEPDEEQGSMDDQGGGMGQDDGMDSGGDSGADDGMGGGDGMDSGGGGDSGNDS